MLLKVTALGAAIIFGFDTVMPWPPMCVSSTAPAYPLVIGNTVSIAKQCSLHVGARPDLLRGWPLRPRAAAAAAGASGVEEPGARRRPQGGEHVRPQCAAPRGEQPNTKV